MYIYLGKYYHKSGKELSDLTEKKIGLTKSLENRERELNSTKFTIGYTFVKAWETGLDTNRVERSLHAILDNDRMEGEWFEDSENTLTSRVSSYMNINGYPEVSLLRSDINNLNDDDKAAIKASNTDLINHNVTQMINKLETLNVQYEQKYDSDKEAPFFSIDMDGSRVIMGMYSSGTKFYLYATGKSAFDKIQYSRTWEERFSESSGKLRLGEKSTSYADNVEDLLTKLDIFYQELVTGVVGNSI